MCVLSASSVASVVTNADVTVVHGAATGLDFYPGRSLQVGQSRNAVGGGDDLDRVEEGAILETSHLFMDGHATRVLLEYGMSRMTKRVFREVQGLSWKSLLGHRPEDWISRGCTVDWRVVYDLSERWKGRGAGRTGLMVLRVELAL